MKSIDLNVDIGEGFPFDDELLKYVSSANVCCGAHAGSLRLTLETVEACKKQGVRVGAHPGIAHRESMGRAAFAGDWSSLLPNLKEQVQYLKELGATYLKPHGELYNAGARLQPASELLHQLVVESQLPLMGMPHTLHQHAAMGSTFLKEGFADRAYDDRGFLVSRSVPGAVLIDPADVVRQAVNLASHVESICVHGDTEGCVELVREVRLALELEGFVVAP